MKRLSSVLLLAALPALGLVQPAHACRCSGPGPGAAALRRADVAVVGEVVEVLGEPPSGPTGFILRVARRFRGDAGATLRVAMPATSCGIRWIAVGERWLVFARRGDGVLTTRQCTGSVRLAAADGTSHPRAARWLRSVARAADADDER